MAAIVLLTAYIVPVTMAGVFRERLPQLVLKAAPYDAGANAAIAQQTLVRGRSGVDIQAARMQALRAFERDPTRITALTTLGLAAAVGRNGPLAERIFAYSESLSRRDVPTQLWLIEHEVGLNNISGALHHYDTAMRSSEEIKTRLFPILTEASKDRAIAGHLNRVLRTRPPWGRELLSYILWTTGDAEELATVSRGLINPEIPEERELGLQLFNRLIELRRFDLAWSAFADAAPRPASDRALLRDGSFREDRGFPPFDWAYSEDASLSPERRPRDSSSTSFALYLPTDASAEGLSARQLMRLAPGSYQLESRVGDVPEDATLRPYIRVACAGSPQRQLLQADFPAAASETAMTARFTVAPGCRDQWISILVRGTLDAAPRNAPWIAALSIRRL